MFAQLPENLQDQVLNYLKADNFHAAKQIHDAWLARNLNQKLVNNQENHAVQ